MVVFSICGFSHKCVVLNSIGVQKSKLTLKFPYIPPGMGMRFAVEASSIRL